MNRDLQPSSAQRRYLSLGYRRFYNLFDEITADVFWELDPKNRFSKIKDIFLIYTELIKYKPIASVIANDTRPHAGLLARDLVKFTRNVLQHFPFFEEWDDVYIDRELVTALESPSSVDRFLSYTHPYDTKFRMWDSHRKTMTYVDVNLNTGYSKGYSVFLSEMLNEQDGIKLLCFIMRKYLDTQLESRLML